MNKILEELIKDLNPIHDFDDIKFHSLSNANSHQERIKIKFKNLKIIVYSAKPFVRGSIYGGLAVGIANLVSDYPLSWNTIGLGALLGVAIDFNFYYIRGIRYLCKKESE